MPNDRIISLSAPFNPRRRAVSAPFVPARFRSARAHQGLGASLSAEMVGEAYGRLASMVLASKLASGDAPIGRNARAAMVAASGIPESLASHDMTNMVFFADSAQLGKGGTLGQIVNTVTHVVSQGVQGVDAVVRAAGQVITKVPIIGPAVGKIVMTAADAQDRIAKANLKTDAGIATGLATSVATSLVSRVVPQSAQNALGQIAGPPQVPTQAGAYPQTTPTDVSGVPVYPAGISMPGGPSESGLVTDPAFPGVVANVAANALKTAPAPAAPSAAASLMAPALSILGMMLLNRKG